MTATTSPRYYLPRKAIKADCPQCSPRHRKTLSRFVDRETDEVLPESFGRCDRESNCGYYLSPYHKTASGMSYADEQKGPLMPKEWYQLAGTQQRQGVTRQGVVRLLVEEGAAPQQAERVAAYVFDRAVIRPGREPQQPPAPIYSLPHEVMSKTIGHYDRNEFARFLSSRFGYAIAAELLERFHVGTSNRWPGACVFWLIDEQDRVRGGQITLYDQSGHKVKRTYTDSEGHPKTKVCITSVRAALKWKYRDITPPDWLAALPDDAETWPVVFGLPQLKDTPPDRPVALVEGPKTAIICSHLLPGFVWLAVGGKSYLKPERLAALKGRVLMLYPDLNAFDDWQKRADVLRAEGFRVDVSDVLEQLATDEDRAKGLDLADFFLREPNRITSFSQWLPGQRVKLDESRIERLTVEPCQNYPPEWDQPDSPGTLPTIKAVPCRSAADFHKWQTQHPYFGQMGLASLTPSQREQLLKQP